MFKVNYVNVTFHTTDSLSSIDKKKKIIIKNKHSLPVRNMLKLDCSTCSPTRLLWRPYRRGNDTLLVSTHKLNTFGRHGDAQVPPTRGRLFGSHPAVRFVAGWIVRHHDVRKGALVSARLAGTVAWDSGHRSTRLSHIE